MKDGLSCALRAILWFMIIAAGFRYVAAPWIFSFFYSFQVHIGVAVMVGAIAAWLLKRSRVALLQFFIGVFLAAHPFLMQRAFVGPPPAPGAKVEEIRLMSLNILGDNWENAPAIADLVLDADPDVVYLLEAEPMRYELQRLEKRYDYRMGCGILTETCDLVILSKRPLVANRMVSLSDLRRDRFALMDIEIGGRPIHFAAAHLSKPYFDDYHFEELRSIRAQFRGLTGDFVLAGDFNSSSLAPDMQDFLRRTGLRTGRSEPTTWPIEAGRFGIAIDHIFATPGVAILSLDRVVIPGSNHFGLEAKLGVVLN